MPKLAHAQFAPAPVALADEGAGSCFDRPLTRLLDRAHADFAVLCRRMPHRAGLTQLAAAAVPGVEIEPFARDTAALLATAVHSDNAVTGGSRTIVRWLDQPRMANLVLVAARAAAAPPFDADDIAALADSAEWIEDVAGLWWRNRRTEARLAGMRAGFGTRDTGAILLDGQGCILETNAMARRMLRSGTGLRRAGNRLTATDPDDAARLREAWFLAIAALTTGRREPPRELTIARHANQRPLLVAIHRPPAAAVPEDRDDPRLLLLIVDPDAKRDIEGACAVYHLTESQTRLTKKLVDGLSVTEAAAALGLSAETGRTYLKEIFRRTGVNRQAELVRLLLNSCVPVARSLGRRLPTDRRAEALSAAKAYFSVETAHQGLIPRPRTMPPLRQ